MTGAVGGSINSTTLKHDTSMILVVTLSLELERLTVGWCAGETFETSVRAKEGRGRKRINYKISSNVFVSIYFCVSIIILYMYTIYRSVYKYR